MKIAILGAGNMGLSFSKSFLKYELIKPQDLHLITRSQSKISKIAEEFPKSQISTFEETKELDADLIIAGISACYSEFPVYPERKSDGSFHYGRN
jgi:pyrroline-5-carboxylate reductase